MCRSEVRDLKKSRSSHPDGVGNALRHLGWNRQDRKDPAHEKAPQKIIPHYSQEHAVSVVAKNTSPTGDNKGRCKSFALKIHFYCLSSLTQPKDSTRDGASTQTHHARSDRTFYKILLVSILFFHSTACLTIYSHSLLPVSIVPPTKLDTKKRRVKVLGIFRPA